MKKAVEARATDMIMSKYDCQKFLSNSGVSCEILAKAIQNRLTRCHV